MEQTLVKYVMILSIVLVLISHLLLPAWFTASLWRGVFRSKLSWLASTLGFGSYILWISLVGAGWDVVSYYLRVGVPVAFLCAVYASLRRISRTGTPWWRRPESPGGWLALALNVLLAVYFTWSTVIAVQGFSYGDAQAVELSFPLKDGVFFVSHGGSSPALNHHHVDKAQRYALDIVKLNAAGTRAFGIYPSDPARYAAFGEPIYSPCTGEVIATRDGLPDNNPPDADRENLAGDHVVVRCPDQDVDVLLAHMMKGSIAVRSGHRVETGQLVGRVGNSGNTSEPHLHVHAVKTGSGDVLDGEGTPIRFDGRFLVRNNLVFR